MHFTGSYHLKGTLTETFSFKVKSFFLLIIKNNSEIDCISRFCFCFFLFSDNKARNRIFLFPPLALPYSNFYLF